MKKIYLTGLGVLSLLITAAQTGSQSFTSSGLFTVPAGVTSITIEVLGAGGDGGGNGGGGGGGGGYAAGTYTVTPLTTLSVTVGVAGGGTISGTSSVSTLIAASGGENGTSVSNPNLGGGGNGGSGTGGNIANFTGGTGGGGYWTYFGGGGGGAAGPSGNGGIGGNTIIWTGICQTPGGSAGISGGVPGGDGGKGAGFTDVNCNVSDPAANGVNYGGGGGGGNGNGAPAMSGAPGYVSITWGTTSVSTYQETQNFQAYPNPFTGKLKIKNLTGNEEFELINLYGQILWRGKNIDQNDFSNLPSDNYIIRIISEGTSSTMRIFKTDK